jgi:hypothetical protein
MSKWPDGFDVSVGNYGAQGGWFAYVYDRRRPNVSWVHLPGYTTEQQAEAAAIDWIQRRIDPPETVPHPVLPKHDRRSLINAEGHVKDLLWWLSQLEHGLPAPKQSDYPDEQHVAAADCWQYRCGLIEVLRKSLREELEMIREKL